MPDRHQVWAFCISYVELRFLPMFRTFTFSWVCVTSALPASDIFFLCNRKRTESGTPDVKRGSVCALVGYQWCGELHFAGAAISTDGCPPQTPRRDRPKSFWTSSVLYKMLVSTWRLIVHFSKAGRFWRMFEGPWWRWNIYLCGLHVTLLSKITPRYFTTFTKGMFRPCNVRWVPICQHLWEKQMGWVLPSLIFMFQRSQHASIALGPRCSFLSRTLPFNNNQLRARNSPNHSHTFHTAELVSTVSKWQYM
jgi:hypothetical protein